MPEEKEAGLPSRSRLPGFDEESGRGYRGDQGDRGGYGPAEHGPYSYAPPRGYEPRGYEPRGYEHPGYYQYPPPAYARDSGIRASRRTSTWTAAALIAAVAATTGYLAHSIPSGSSTSGTTVGHTTTKHSSQSGSVQSGAPGVSGPVVTSGGSGAAAGRGGDN